jgi:hypothetical protein
MTWAIIGLNLTKLPGRSRNNGPIGFVVLTVMLTMFTRNKIVYKDETVLHLLCTSLSYWESWK